MKLYSYVVTHDFGFAPNPYGGVLTLATCKPRIRRFASPGDWILGTGSAKGIGCNRLIFAAKVSMSMPTAEYGASTTYQFKIPSKERRHGDNIYFRDVRNDWNQRRNPFHGFEEMKHDLSGENVLVCREYWYFGDRAPTLPTKFQCLVKRGPNHKNNTKHPKADVFINWLRKFEAGVIGQPSSRAI